MGKVVVGVDGSPGSTAALRFAVEEARLRGAALHAVQASDAPEWAGQSGGYVVVGAPAERHDLAGLDETLAAAATQALEAQLEGVDTAGVEVALEVFSGDPARVLLDAAQDADLLVVGSRGRGGFRGLVLGSTSQKVAHHTPCPVVIVRADD
jgi:nucleotide-binding universal stress UspA family protein